MNPWIKAIRLRTLPLAWASLSMGAILAHLDDAFNAVIYLLSVLTAFGLQIASNLANDYGDAVTGLDGDSRAGPKRAVQQGLISREQMEKAIIAACAVSFVMGVALIFLAFDSWTLRTIFLALGLASIVAALRYTMGKNPYGYVGWGDVYVLIFFGWMGVLGSYFLYTQTFSWPVVLPASTLGLFAVAVLNVNNIRDIASDKISGKYSIPVRIGRKNAVIYHIIILFIAFACVCAFAWLRDFDIHGWLFVLVCPLLIFNALGVSRQTEPDRLDPFLKQMAISTLLFVVLFGLGVVI